MSKLLQKYQFIPYIMIYLWLRCREFHIKKIKKTHTPYMIGRLLI